MSTGEEGLTLVIDGTSSIWRVPPTAAEKATMDGFIDRIEKKRVRGRCATCAFRRGTEANSSGLVVRLVERCLTDPMENGEFRCHEDGRRDQACAGFAKVRELGVWRQGVKHGGRKEA